MPRLVAATARPVSPSPRPSSLCARWPGSGHARPEEWKEGACIGRNQETNTGVPCSDLGNENPRDATARVGRSPIGSGVTLLSRRQHGVSCEAGPITSPGPFSSPHLWPEKMGGDGGPRPSGLLESRAAAAYWAKIAKLLFIASNVIFRAS